MGDTTPEYNYGRDSTFMETKHSGSTAYVGRWKAKYGFDGNLTIDNCEALLQSVLLHHKQKINEYDEEAKFCKLWLAEAKLRNMHARGQRRYGPGGHRPGDTGQRTENNRIARRTGCCFICGSMTHWARNCSLNEENNTNSNDKCT